MARSTALLAAAALVLGLGCPTHSQVYDRIAFVSYRDTDFSQALPALNHEIYSMATDGSDQVNLTQSQASDIDPAWCPDGTRIAYASDRSGTYQIYVMDPDGQAVQQAKLGYLVEGPNGAKQKLMAMGMQGAYGANVDFRNKGSYTIKTKIVTGDMKLFDRFNHEVK